MFFILPVNAISPSLYQPYESYILGRGKSVYNVQFLGNKKTAPPTHQTIIL